MRVRVLSNCPLLEALLMLATQQVPALILDPAYSACYLSCCRCRRRRRNRRAASPIFAVAVPLGAGCPGQHAL